MSNVSNPNSAFGFFNINLGDFDLMVRGDDDFICLVPHAKFSEVKEHAYVPMSVFKQWLSEKLDEYQPHD